MYSLLHLGVCRLTSTIKHQQIYTQTSIDSKEKRLQRGGSTLKLRQSRQCRCYSVVLIWIFVCMRRGSQLYNKHSVRSIWCRYPQQEWDTNSWKIFPHRHRPCRQQTFLTQTSWASSLIRFASMLNNQIFGTFQTPCNIQTSFHRSFFFLQYHSTHLAWIASGSIRQKHKVWKTI